MEYLNFMHLKGVERMGFEQLIYHSLGQSVENWAIVVTG